MKSASASARLASRRYSCASPLRPETVRQLPAAAISPRPSTPSSARKRAGSAGSPLRAGIASAGTAGSANDGCACETGAGDARRLWRDAVVGPACACPVARRPGRGRRWTEARATAQAQLRAAAVACCHALWLHHRRLWPRRRVALGSAARRRQPHRGPRCPPRARAPRCAGPARTGQARHIFPKELGA